MKGRESLALGEPSDTARRSGARTSGDGRQSGHSDEGEGDMTGVPIMPCEMACQAKATRKIQSLVALSNLDSSLLEFLNAGDEISWRCIAPFGVPERAGITVFPGETVFIVRCARSG